MGEREWEIAWEVGSRIVRRRSREAGLLRQWINQKCRFTGFWSSKLPSADGLWQLGREDFDTIPVNTRDCVKDGWIFFVCKGRLLLPHSSSDSLGGRWCYRELPTCFLSGHHFVTETTKRQGILLSCSINAGSWKDNLWTAETSCAFPKELDILVGAIHQIKMLV